MIIDIFPFLNELDLLELRLNHLRGHVDLHILVESRETFSGLNKPLYYEENKGRYQQFPIHHIILDSLPDASPSDRDMWQKSQGWKAAVAMRPDIALVMDLDELPRVEAITRFKELRHVQTASLFMDVLLFYLDRQDPHPWFYPKITRDFTREPLRYESLDKHITGAGWHLEYFGSRDTLLEKIRSTAHAHEEGGKDFYQKVERGNLDGLERTIPYAIEKLPKYVKDNISHYKELGFFSPKCSTQT
jgi:beta-1,4-mannosyl-glycoprotein beta-1,4-N-acetylglucosaminyltransferase